MLPKLDPKRRKAGFYTQLFSNVKGFQTRITHDLAVGGKERKLGTFRKGHTTLKPGIWGLKWFEGQCSGGPRSKTKSQQSREKKPAEGSRGSQQETIVLTSKDLARRSEEQFSGAWGSSIMEACPRSWWGFGHPNLGLGQDKNFESTGRFKVNCCHSSVGEIGKITLARLLWARSAWAQSPWRGKNGSWD